MNELALTMIGSIQVSLTMIDNDWTVWPVPDLNHTLAALMCPLACWGWHLVDDNDEEIEIIMNNKIIKICLKFKSLSSSNHGRDLDNSKLSSSLAGILFEL